jgi:hypothetical protein
VDKGWTEITSEGFDGFLFSKTSPLFEGTHFPFMKFPYSLIVGYFKLDK